MPADLEIRPAPVPRLHDCLLLGGPTAVGKSEVALHLAEQIGAEIVSVDSMQVYCGMDIGTAKPSKAERDRVPHHGIDVVEVTEEFDAAKFLKLAGASITGILERGRTPILCGGTGLYFKALLEGLGQAPAANASLRRELEATPLSELLRELAEGDPVACEKIDRQNPRRVVRAIEVIRLTGKPFSGQRAPWAAAAAGQGRVRFFGLARGSGELTERIHQRVEAMFRAGLVEETGSLLKRGLGGNRTALQALGYRQVYEFLQGARSLEETIELVKIRTRQFAKRQMTWFRRQFALKWMHIEHEERPECIARDLAEAFRRAL